MLRILHVMGCSDAGGISSVVLNYDRFIDREKIHFDIALTVPHEGQNSRALEKLGAKIWFLPMKSQDPEGFRRELTRILTEGKYDGIHVHESETCYVALKLAKKLGIPCRIAHAHTSSPYEGLKGEIRRLSGCLLNYPYASHVIACGILAGNRVFGKYNMKRPGALVLPNAVDTEKFAFDPQIRAEMRRELGVENRLVLGMVGRLSEEKNDLFPLKLLPELKKKYPDIVLLMAGNGPEEENIRGEIQRLGLEESVRLLGRRGDVPGLLQAFDIFLLPSLHEGFPVCAVEALASGLPVLLSDTITKELDFARGLQYLPLEKPEVWISAVEPWIGDQGREQRQHQVKEHGLDLRDCAGMLQKIYEEDCGRGEQHG